MNKLIDVGWCLLVVVMVPAAMLALLVALDVEAERRAAEAPGCYCQEPAKGEISDLAECPSWEF